jgi:hypothetical protein
MRNLTYVKGFPGQEHECRRGTLMQTRSDQGRLALAQAKFEPVARVLDRLSCEIERDCGLPAVLKPRGAMQQTARNVCEVRYALRCRQEVDLSLTFLVVGDDADRLLLKKQASGPDDNRTDPGQVDQRVYQLGEVEAIKTAVREKIVDYFRARGVLHRDSRRAAAPARAAE